MSAHAKTSIKNYFLAVGLTQEIAMARVYMALSMYAYISSAAALYATTTDRVTPLVCLIGVVSAYIGTHLVEIGKAKLARVIRPLFALGIIIYSSYATGGLSSPFIYWFFSIILGVMFSFGARPGMLALVVQSIIGIVYYRQGTGSSLQLTMLLLTLPNTYVIGLLFSQVSDFYLKKFEREKIKVEKSLEIQKTLTEQIEASSRSMKVILETIREGIVKFGTDFRISGESSAWAFELFHFRPGDTILDYLNKINAGEDNKHASTEALRVSLGESVLNWQVNEANLLKSGIYDGMHLSLHWTPIVKDGIVEECILSVLDETEKVTTELLVKAADERSVRLLSKAKVLVSGNVRATQSFMADVPRLLQGLENLHKKGPETTTVLRNIHTIKGGARTLHMKELTELAHAIEEAYRFDHLYLVERMSLDLIRELDEYRTALHEVLGVADGQGRNTVFDIVAQIREDLGDRLKASGIGFDGITVTDKLGSVPAEIRDILLHGLTNATDHGYILPQERGQTVSEVHLSILAFREKDFNVLKIIDNGIGINWSQIAGICSKKGFVPKEGRPQTDVLFLGGSSTAGTVTATSGRGIGMSAIKMATESIGGTVSFIDREDGQGAMLLVSWPAPAQSMDVMQRAS